MAVQLKYSDILQDILQRKHSRCICPEYASDFSRAKSPKRPSTGGSCHFGPNCNFTTCDFNQGKCTCNGKGVCGLQADLPPLQSQPPANKKPTKGCSRPDCICIGACYCKSEDSLLSKSVSHPPRDCNKALCTCRVCLCQPLESPSNLLPTAFRNVVKVEANQLMSDELMKRECAEIKQLLAEHEASKKKESEKSKHFSSENVRMKKSPSKKSITLDIDRPTSPAQRPSFPQSTSSDGSHKAILRPTSTKSPSITLSPSAPPSAQPPLSRSQSVRKDKKSQRKEKTVKKKPMNPPSTAKTKFVSSYCGCRSVVKKPLRIRYYYSGSTENYGVKLGHKQCLQPPQQVPKNMGWLWNIEDPSKGIRERKGWPPGFIGKNIKNMIKVLQRSQEQASEWGAEGSRRESARGWRPAEFVEVADERGDEPPLLHIHKKGRTYDITFCPRESDEDIGPVPIPFSITEKRREGESGTDSSESSLEFELHSPKPRGPPRLVRKVTRPPTPTTSRAPSLGTTTTATKRPKRRDKSAKPQSTQDETKVLWEEQPTQIQNIA